MFDFLAQKFSSIFSSLSGKGRMTDQAIDQTMDKVHDALLEADVPLAVVQDFVASVKKEIAEQSLAAHINASDQIIKIVFERLKNFLGSQPALVSFQIPSVIMVMGLQGSGKTTSVAKIAHYIMEAAHARGKKRSILLASVDFTRPAAIDQLAQLAQQTGVPFYRSQATDPVKAAHEIYAHFKKEGFEHLFLDTAGRLHVDSALLEQLRSIDADLKPRYKILVLDSMTGQESLRVARAFDQGVGYDYALLTKMDSDTRCGAAFAFAYDQKKPIMFVGIGEKIADLEQFYPERMASRILGMGDIQTLIERVESKSKQLDTENAQKAFAQGKMNLQDFADQLAMINKLGPLQSIARYLPGMGGATLSPEMLEKGEAELIKFRAIISSMTPKERLVPRIIDASRKARIAKGAGVEVATVTLLLSRFEETVQYAKLFKKMWRRPFA